MVISLCILENAIRIRISVLVFAKHGLYGNFATDQVVVMDSKETLYYPCCHYLTLFSRKGNLRNSKISNYWIDLLKKV